MKGGHVALGEWSVAFRPTDQRSTATVVTLIAGVLPRPRRIALTVFAAKEIICLAFVRSVDTPGATSTRAIQLARTLPFFRIASEDRTVSTCPVAEAIFTGILREAETEE